MSYVFYDVETTGLNTRFDQITQFAAVRTDQDLNVVERFEIRLRLSPHIIPSPGALRITRCAISSLIDASLPSPYEGVGQIYAKLSSWPPSAYIGYNSISFDEEILRHSLFQSLYYPYLTTGKDKLRADALGLMRVAASLRPDALKPGVSQEGKASFKLVDLAIANGIPVAKAHDAAVDVELTRSLCKLIKTNADELWWRLIRFGKKATAEEFIKGEAVFAFCEVRKGNSANVRIATRFGQPDKPGNTHYALDLSCDPKSLATLTIEALAEKFSERQSPLISIKVNASPSMCSLHECEPEMLGELSMDQAERRAEVLLSDTALLSRLEAAARSLEKDWPQSPYVEEQLYGDWKASDADKQLQATFHQASWSDKARIASQFNEPRYRRVAQRLVYFNSPEHLSEKARNAICIEIDRRLREPLSVKTPWLTIARAHAELDNILAECADESERIPLLAYREYLEGRFGPRA